MTEHNWATAGAESFLTDRPRRLRATAALRDMTRETELNAADFLYPLFITHGKNIRQEVPSMPGVFQISVDQLAREIDELLGLRIRGVLLFGIPETKDATGSDTRRCDGIIQQAIRAIKQRTHELVVVSDVCFCEYTDHGHCGPLVKNRAGALTVDNDATLALLGEQAVSHADAGVDIVAPSGMMDGFVAATRRALDGAGFSEVPILAYSAKYASAFYGPFRDAAQSAPAFGDRRTYQMDPANRREALREVNLDLDQGADMVMVKPALSYLDVLRDIRQMSKVPVAAYNVSGEYAMVKAASRNGWLDERRVALEILTSIKRAGADIVITYHAKDAAGWLRDEK